MDKFKELEALIISMNADINKFYEKKNKSAGVRIRKALQDVKALAQQIRIDISEQKNA